MNSKYKYLIKNVGLLTVSNFGTKILSFILIPIYTSILSTADYGTYDVYSTTISLLIPVLAINIVEAVMRFTLDKTYNKSTVFSVGLKLSLIACAVLCALVGINSAFKIIPIFSEYPVFLILLFLGSIFYELLSQFARGIERIYDLAIAGAINAVVMLVMNILFLVVFKFGLKGYFLANCFSYFIPIIYYVFRLKIWKYISFKSDKKVETEMKRYSRPMIVNTISWWINNVSDRYIVTWICGVAANGIYSVAYKIPSILNVFQSIFSKAWTLSAVKEFDESSGEFYTNIYKTYCVGMTIVCSTLILMDKFIAKLLFAKDFYIAWQYAPFLMMSVVFGALSGMLGGIFIAAKDSKKLAQTTFMGAIINTILNLILVRFMGPVGAAIATLVSYVVVWAFRIRSAMKIIDIRFNFVKEILAYVLLLVQCAFWFTGVTEIQKYIVELILWIVIFAIYFNEIKSLLHKALKKNKKD